MSTFSLCMGVCIIWSGLTVTVHAEPTIEPDEQGFAITSETYSARISTRGHLETVVVNGAASLSCQFPEVEAPLLNQIGNKVVVRQGERRTEWTFFDDRIAVLAEGYEFSLSADPSVRAVLVPGGKGGQYARNLHFEHANALVLQNGRTVQFNTPMHVAAGRVVPSAYVLGKVKPGEKIELELTLGASAEAVELLSSLTITGPKAIADSLAKEGGVGQGFTHFDDGDSVALISTQRNSGDKELVVEYRLKVVDHHTLAKVVHSETQKTTVLAGVDGVVQWSLPPLAPGFYYTTIEVVADGEKVTEGRLTFGVDLPDYKPPLTRPSDFADFWKEWDDKSASAGLEAVERLASGPDAPRVYDVSFAMPDGKRARAVLFRGENPGLTITSTMDGVLDDTLAKAAAGKFDPNEWQSKQGSILWITVPEQATFTRWESAGENNLLDAIRVWIRAIDYARASPLLKNEPIKLFGASRGGPLAFISAARRPQAVAGVDIHVPTSAGLSWTDKPYRGWGVPPGHQPGDAEKLRRLTSIAAYVDPVNHAPDVIAPLIISYGVDDDLSPPQGIEAMYRWAASDWKRISRDAGGHQYAPAFKQLQLELAKQIGAPPAAATDERTMKEH